jgi:hypothetical protein
MAGEKLIERMGSIDILPIYIKTLSNILVDVIKYRFTPSFIPGMVRIPEIIRVFCR